MSAGPIPLHSPATQLNNSGAAHGSHMVGGIKPEPDVGMSGASYGAPSQQPLGLLHAGFGGGSLPMLGSDSMPGSALPMPNGTHILHGTVPCAPPPPPMHGGACAGLPMYGLPVLGSMVPQPHLDGGLLPPPLDGMPPPASLAAYPDSGSRHASMFAFGCSSPGSSSAAATQFGGAGAHAGNNHSADSLHLPQALGAPAAATGAAGSGGAASPAQGNEAAVHAGGAATVGHSLAPPSPECPAAPQASTRGGTRGASASAQHGGGGGGGGGAAAAPQVFRSQYRGVSYDKKKRKWRVQIKVAALGKSGVSVGYFDTEDAAARAYDRAAIGLLGRANCRAILNYPIEEYDREHVPELVGKSREEVKATLKSERAKLPRRRLTNRRRTSRYLGVGSSNRKNQWQARILYHGKVTHLGYYRTEEEAARVFDKVSISLHGANAQTNFPIDQYQQEVSALQQKLSGLSREELQRALGVKPMDKGSKYRGVSKKKAKWEAKVLLNRKWAYREQFDTELEAARAYDAAAWRLKPREAGSYVNFKDSCPADVAAMLVAADADGGLAQLPLLPCGLAVTAAALVDAGLVVDEDGVSLAAHGGSARVTDAGELLSLGGQTHSSGAGSSSCDASGSGGVGAALDTASGGVLGPMAAGTASGAASGAAAGGAAGGGGGGGGGMPRSSSWASLGCLDDDSGGGGAGGVGSRRSLAAVGGAAAGGRARKRVGGMTRVQSTPALQSYTSSGGGGSGPAAAHDASAAVEGGLHGTYLSGSLTGGGMKPEGSYWNTELPYHDGNGSPLLHGGFGQPQAVSGLPALQQQSGSLMGARSRSCGSLMALAGNGSSPMLSHHSPTLLPAAGGDSSLEVGDHKPLLVRVGSETHLITYEQQQQHSVHIFQHHQQQHHHHHHQQQHHQQQHHQQQHHQQQQQQPLGTGRLTGMTRISSEPQLSSLGAPSSMGGGGGGGGGGGASLDPSGRPRSSLGAVRPGTAPAAHGMPRCHSVAGLESIDEMRASGACHAAAAAAAAGLGLGLGCSSEPHMCDFGGGQGHAHGLSQAPVALPVGMQQSSMMDWQQHPLPKHDSAHFGGLSSPNAFSSHPRHFGASGSHAAGVFSDVFERGGSGLFSAGAQPGGSGKWPDMDAPSSPFALKGVHIGGEELDVAMSFLEDDPEPPHGLSYGGAGGQAALGVHSPGHSGALGLGGRGDGDDDIAALAAEFGGMDDMP